MPKLLDIAFANELSNLSYLLGALDGNFCRFPSSLFRGNKWHIAYAAPANAIGDDGDLCLDVTNSDVYQKVSGSWGAPILNVKGAAGTDGVNGTDGISPKEIYYNISGTLTVRLGKLKRYISTNHTITTVKVLLGTPSEGSGIKFDIRRNGSAHSIFSADVEIPQNAVSHTISTFSNTELVAGDYLTVDISQVGNSTPGADLSMTIILA